MTTDSSNQPPGRIRGEGTSRTGNGRRIGALIFVLIVSAVWVAKEVLYPIALAGVLALLVVPLVRALERIRVPRAAASISMVLVASLVIATLFWFVGNQLTGIIKELPSYQENIHQRIESLRGGRSGILHIADKTLRNLKEDIAIDAPPAGPGAVGENGNPGATRDPLPVTIVQPHTMTSADFVDLSLSVLHPVLTVGIVFIFAVFMLIQRDDLHRRFMLISRRFVQPHGPSLSTGALDEAFGKITRYLLMQSMTNVLTGLAVAIGLYLLDVPHPFFWGLLTFLLRYVPYVGVLLATLIVGFFTVAVFPTWNPTMYVLGMFLAIEIIVGNVIEPFFFGHGTGLSSFAIIIAATFWTWVWGPVGLFLSVPLTVCLVVIGRYVPSLDFLEILLADEGGAKGATRRFTANADAQPTIAAAPLGPSLPPAG